MADWECHNRVTESAYRSICTEYWLETPRVKMEPLKVVEKDQARIRWAFQIPTDKMAMANRRDAVIVDKQQKKAAVIDAAIPSDN